MMHARFPDVRRWEETSDVLQQVFIRLDRALRTVAVTDAKHFLCLAADHIRFELIDLARRVRGASGPLGHHATPPRGEDGRPLPPDAADPDTPDALDWWQALHDEAGRLPEPQREVFALAWYNGCTQDEIARLLAVSVSTVKRRWEEAQVRLFDKLGEGVPDGFGENA
jgi:RNA polymerase sigma-70 factor (ECF subfamily)